MFMKYPKVKQMMGNMPKPVPAAPTPAMPAQPSNPFSPPRSPLVGQTALGAAPTPAMRSPRSTLPSISANANEETPIELGDPKRLAKIATILRMGRK